MNQGNNKNNEFEFEIEDLSIDDGKIELEVKPDQSVGNGTVYNPSDEESISLSDEDLQTNDSNDSLVDESNDNDGNLDSSNQESTNDDLLEEQSNSDSKEFDKQEDESLDNNEKYNSSDTEGEDVKRGDLDKEEDDSPDKKPKSDLQEPNEQKNETSDNNEKSNSNNHQNDDAKQSDSDKKDDDFKDSNKRESSNQNKNKKDDRNPMINKANDKGPKNALDNKRQGLKDKWNNRPKTPKDFANRAKSGIKNKAQNRFNNSKLGQTVNKGKNAIDKGKKAVNRAKKVAKTAKKVAKVAVKGVKAIAALIKAAIAAWPVTLTVLAAIAVVVCIFALLPGSKGSSSNDYNKYSKADQKTLTKMKKIFDQYPNADGTLLLSTMNYPYFNILWSSNVSKGISQEYSDQFSEEEAEVEEGDDTEEVQKEDKVGDDLFLEIFKKYSYRKKLKKLAKKLSEEGETAYFEYLKSDYFESEKAYKSMLSGVSNADELKNLMIEDIKNNKDLFINYVYKNAVCASTLLDAGQIETQDLLKGNVLVDLKKPGCSNMKSCSESYYDNYLTLEEYVKGVVYEEIAGNKDVNQIAAQMVAAKTFTLSRRTGSIKIDEATGAYVIPMLWSTADQDFCHVDKGCNAEDIKDHYGYERGNDTRLFHGANRGPASDEQKELYNEAWNLSKDVYVVNNDGSPAATAYYAGCSAGKCMDQEKLPNYSGIEFKSILSTFYSSYSISTVEGDVSNIQVRGEQVCTNASTNYSATRARIVAFGLDQVGKIPYYEEGLADVSGFEGNNFGTEVEADINGRDKKGLGSVGFVNWVYWSVIEDNLTNSNNLDVIISQGFEVAQDKLLMGDIGYSEDKTVVGIYAGDNRWILEDSITGNVVAQPDDRITKFIRHNSFKSETYNFTIRDHAPTPSEWGRDKIVYPGSAGYIGECPWYAKNRAGEIIDELYKNGSLTEKQYKKYYERLRSTSGDGGEYYPGGVASKAGYNGSTNIEDLRAGSFIGMSSHWSSKGVTYGHVAVVESVSEDKIVITEGSDTNNTCTSTNFGCLKFGYKEFNSYQEFYDYYQNPNGYMFKGYLYFLED